MAKRIESKRKLPASSAALKSDKSKVDAQERQARLREEQALRDQREEERLTFEQQVREQRLKPTCAMLAELSRKKHEHERACRDELDWNHWVRCDGTPNPLVVQELNTYLFVWRQVCQVSYDGDSYVDKCLEIFKIMDAVDDVVDMPLDFDPFKLQCFREARDDLGRLLADTVLGACYYLLSDYERRMEAADPETAAYGHACDAFAVGLRAACHRPRLRTDDRPAPRCDFAECLVAVDVPPQLSRHHMAVMALWLRWDPFADRAARFEAAAAAAEDDRDLWRYAADTWDERERERRKRDADRGREVRRQWAAQMEEKLAAFAAVDPSRYPDELRAYVDGGRGDGGEEPDETVESLAQRPTDAVVSDAMKYPEKPNELNPRRYWVIGGAFVVEMWELPAQPVQHADGTVAVMLVGPSALQPVEYREAYEPMQLSAGFSSTSSEDEETDVKKHNQEALKRLALISVRLPDNVLWFENPRPAAWDEDKRAWTTDYIYDVRFNEEKQTVSFRAGRTGSFGLAVNRYTNFPFQSWEVRPAGGGGGGGMVLSVTAATVLVEFAVRGDRAAMVQLQNATTVALQEMIGAYHRPDRLVRLLRRGGVNLFPEPDALHYVDGRRPPKHAVAERHTYRCMAALSGTHQFAASRWNAHAPADRMVFQMKERPAARPDVVAAAAAGEDDDGGEEGGGGAVVGGGGGGGGAGGGTSVPYAMVMVTPERAVLLRCTEVSQAFSEDPLNAGAPFAPDLYALAATNADVVDFDTVQTLFYLMDKIKFLSYS